MRMQVVTTCLSAAEAGATCLKASSLYGLMLLSCVSVMTQSPFAAHQLFPVCLQSET